MYAFNNSLVSTGSFQNYVMPLLEACIKLNIWNHYWRLSFLCPAFFHWTWTFIAVESSSSKHNKLYSHALLGKYNISHLRNKAHILLPSLCRTTILYALQNVYTSKRETNRLDWCQNALPAAFKVFSFNINRVVKLQHFFFFVPWV